MNQQPQEPQASSILRPEQQTANERSAAHTAATQPQCWTPTCIPLPVVDEKETDTQGIEVLTEINLVDFIGKGSRNAKNHLTERRYLSSTYSYNSAQFRKKKLAPLFQKACARAGFEVHNKGWEEHRQMIRFACNRSRPYKAKVDSSERKTKQRGISRPLETEHTCPFNFSVYWEAGNKLGTGRWFVCPCGMGKSIHVGHEAKPYEELQPKLSPQDAAYQKFLPQYQKFCLLASTQMDRADTILQDGIAKLEQAAPKKRKRGRKPKSWNPPQHPTSPLPYTAAQMSAKASQVTTDPKTMALPIAPKPTPLPHSAPPAAPKPTIPLPYTEPLTNPKATPLPYTAAQMSNRPMMPPRTAPMMPYYTAAQMSRPPMPYAALPMIPYTAPQMSVPRTLQVMEPKKMPPTASKPYQK